MTIPILPNRLPIQLLTTLAPRLPLPALHLISVPRVISQLPTPEAHIHLIANLAAFTPHRYSALSVPSLTTYLRLTTEVMNALPSQALEPPEKNNTVSVNWTEDDDPDQEHITHVDVVTSFAPQLVIPQLDGKTRTRLQILPSPGHLTSLLDATHHHASPDLRAGLFAWLHALSTVWPSRRDRVVSTVVAWSGGGLVRELYRSYVRSSPLGKSANAATLTGMFGHWLLSNFDSNGMDHADASHASHWPPLLFLVDLYNQALLTMGDEEFISSSAGPSSSSANIESRNPLTLDELRSFSRQLLNIVFLLYWREDQTNVQDSGVPGMPNLKWETAREKMTKLLQAIHAREYVLVVASLLLEHL